MGSELQFGKAFRKLRVETGVSLVPVAEALGTQIERVSDIERAYCMPPILDADTKRMLTAIGRDDEYTVQRFCRMSHADHTIGPKALRVRTEPADESLCTVTHGTFKAMESRISTLEAERDRLRAALRPLAELIEDVPPDAIDKGEMEVFICVKDIRAAALAYGPLEESP